MTKKRKIAVITGSRAEYGILKPLLKKIKESENLELILLVTGMHLLKKYGFTMNDIKKDGFLVSEKIKMYSEDTDDPLYYGDALGEGVKNFNKAFLKTRPDIVVVFGDRLEPLAATLAAATSQFPIVHIHGGDKADDGHIDECVRNSITKFSHIHFPPTEKCKDRIIKMGEKSWRVHNVGALNIESILNTPKIEKEILFGKLNLKTNQKNIVCVFHPINLEADKAGKQMKEIIDSLKELKIQTVIIYPNNDKGSGKIIEEIEKVKNLPFIKIFHNLPHDIYVNLLRNSDLLIGNSSGAMIEAPIMKLPAINIGLRNVGREHSENIIFIEANKNKIIKSINKALHDKEFIKKVKDCKNPYGEGSTSQRIIKTISLIKINKKLLNKETTD
jgi:GDP/UDP-N,N'-diacetylbacillosamine 2-epimerase (hydrolysing)